MDTLNSFHIDYLFYFYSYAFIGWVLETLYSSLSKRRLVNRGFFYGPFIPVYGWGAVMFLFLDGFIPPFVPAAVTMLLFAVTASLLEYYTGLIMENIFNLKLWDYSDQPLNIHGRICLHFSAAWGILGFIQVRWLHGYLALIKNNLDRHIVFIATASVTLYLLGDLLYAVKAFKKFTQLVEILKQDYTGFAGKKFNPLKMRLIGAFPHLGKYINKSITLNLKKAMKEKLSYLTHDNHIKVPDIKNKPANRSEQEFLELTGDILGHPVFSKLKEYKHHDLTIYTHARAVAFLAYKIAGRLSLDYRSAARGALLHDFFFYNWRFKSLYRDGKKKFHAFEHPRIALHNAEKYFKLNAVEKDIILHHMWPLTVRFPRYRETYLVSFVDKLISTREIILDIVNRK
ncbi:MAG TPA: hypothetical protein VKS21_13770 [Spirochaetota bacterium]|nr:hypothetical protein [Spirochaetota bacterium]